MNFNGGILILYSKNEFDLACQLENLLKNENFDAYCIRNKYGRKTDKSYFREKINQAEVVISIGTQEGYDAKRTFTEELDYADNNHSYKLIPVSINESNIPKFKFSHSAYPLKINEGELAPESGDPFEALCKEIKRLPIKFLLMDLKAVAEYGVKEGDSKETKKFIDYLMEEPRLSPFLKLTCLSGSLPKVALYLFEDCTKAGRAGLRGADIEYNTIFKFFMATLFHHDLKMLKAFHGLHYGLQTYIEAISKNLEELGDLAGSEFRSMSLDDEHGDIVKTLLFHDRKLKDQQKDMKYFIVDLVKNGLIPLIKGLSWRIKQLESNGYSEVPSLLNYKNFVPFHSNHFISADHGRLELNDSKEPERWADFLKKFALSFEDSDLYKTFPSLKSNPIIPSSSSSNPEIPEITDLSLLSSWSNFLIRAIPWTLSLVSLVCLWQLHPKGKFELVSRSLSPGNIQYSMNWIYDLRNLKSIVKYSNDTIFEYITFIEKSFDPNLDK